MMGKIKTKSYGWLSRRHEIDADHSSLFSFVCFCFSQEMFILCFKGFVYISRIYCRSCWVCSLAIVCGVDILFHLCSWRFLLQLVTGYRFGCSQISFMNCWLFSAQPYDLHVGVVEAEHEWACEDYGVGYPAI